MTKCPYTKEQLAAISDDIAEIMSDGQPRTAKEIGVLLRRKREDVELSGTMMRMILLNIPGVKESEFQRARGLYVMEV